MENEQFDSWVICLNDDNLITINGVLQHDRSNGLEFKRGTEVVAIITKFQYCLKK